MHRRAMKRTLYMYRPTYLYNAERLCCHLLSPGRATRQQCYESVVDLILELGITFCQRPQQATCTLLSLFRPRPSDALGYRSHSYHVRTHRHNGRVLNTNPTDQTDDLVNDICSDEKNGLIELISAATPIMHKVAEKCFAEPIPPSAYL